MRVLVTGGAGFIGSQVVRSLERAGHEPVVLDVLLPRAHAAVPEPPGREFLRVDVRDADGVRREAVGSRQSAVGSRQSAVGSRRT
ncbi:NAD-dependent epimerase/dehydratase family protein [Streptomyces sp. NRRL F-5193]|uniref:NAD-dependent epimerase/dehydratase family protein n=1 Tax=Streptomyces sp. NRRL F-5193 TaxID=1463860 RepID=UPI0005B7AC20